MGLSGSNDLSHMFDQLTQVDYVFFPFFLIDFSQFQHLILNLL
jgi:hypothetical protein